MLSKTEKTRVLTRGTRTEYYIKKGYNDCYIIQYKFKRESEKYGHDSIEKQVTLFSASGRFIISYDDDYSLTENSNRAFASTS
jgi:hypothetical protein